MPSVGMWALRIVWKGDRMAIKLTKEEARAYVRKIEEENKALKSRCYILSGGGLCVFCGYDCKHREEWSRGQEDGTD